MNFNTKLLYTLFVLSMFLFSCGQTQEAPTNTTTTTVPKAKPVEKLTKEQKFKKAIDRKGVVKTAIVKAIQENPMLLFSKYNLSEEQELAISKSMEVNEVSKVVASPNPKENPKFKAFEREVRALLNPIQAKKFDGLLNKMD